MQAPSDTSHFLQPCDQKVNQVIKKSVKYLREKLCVKSMVHLLSVLTVLMLGKYVFRKLTLTPTPEVICESFQRCQLWPMNFEFLNHFSDDKYSGDDTVKLILCVRLMKIYGKRY